MKVIYLVVFEDNQLELADYGLLYQDKKRAEDVCSQYNDWLNKLSSKRICMVRSMKIS